MKKIITAGALAILCSIGLSSCRKCQICTKSNADEIRTCEGDYGSSTEYGLRLDYLKSQGYTCR